MSSTRPNTIVSSSASALAHNGCATPVDGLVRLAYPDSQIGPSGVMFTLPTPARKSAAQSAAPEAVDLAPGSAETKARYGLDDDRCKDFGAMCLRSRRLVGRDWIGHAGTWAGFTSQHWTLRRRGLTIAVLANLETPGGDQPADGRSQAWIGRSSRIAGGTSTCEISMEKFDNR